MCVDVVLYVTTAVSVGLCLEPQKTVYCKQFIVGILARGTHYHFEPQVEFRAKK